MAPSLRATMPAGSAASAAKNSSRGEPHLLAVALSLPSSLRWAILGWIVLGWIVLGSLSRIPLSDPSRVHSARSAQTRARCDAKAPARRPPQRTVMRQPQHTCQPQPRGTAPASSTEPSAHSPCALQPQHTCQPRPRCTAPPRASSREPSERAVRPLSLRAQLPRLWRVGGCRGRVGVVHGT